MLKLFIQRLLLIICTSPCDPEGAMKLLLGILAVILVAASFFADYKWRRWMAARRQDRK